MDYPIKLYDPERSAAAYNEKMDEFIKKHGRFFRVVFDDCGFLYTYGFTQKGLSEIFSPIGCFTVQRMINELGQDMMDQKQFKVGVPYFSENATVTIDKIPYKLRMRFDNATPEQTRSINEHHGLAAVKRFGKNISWVILHLGDASNKLPGEEGYVKYASFDFKE